MLYWNKHSQRFRCFDDVEDDDDDEPKEEPDAVRWWWFGNVGKLGRIIENEPEPRRAGEEVGDNSSSHDDDDEDEVGGDGGHLISNDADADEDHDDGSIGAVAVAKVTIGSAGGDCGIRW